MAKKPRTTEGDVLEPGAPEPPRTRSGRTSGRASGRSDSQSAAPESVAQAAPNAKKPPRQKAAAASPATGTPAAKAPEGASPAPGQPAGKAKRRDEKKAAGLSSDAILELLKASPAARAPTHFGGGTAPGRPGQKAAKSTDASKVSPDAWSRPAADAPKELPRRNTGKLSERQVEGVRALARTLAAITLENPDDDSDPVMICNPMSEPPALAASELLYDKCKWCQTDIYYDRMMPSPFGITRVCIQCGILLLQAEKKGGN